jgi:hypothetical protein
MQGSLPCLSCRGSSAGVILPCFFGRESNAGLILPCLFSRDSNAGLILPCFFSRECSAWSAGIKLKPDSVSLVINVPRGVQEIPGLKRGKNSKQSSSSYKKRQCHKKVAEIFYCSF